MNGFDETLGCAFGSGVDFDYDSTGGVKRDAGERVAVGEFLYERAKAYALDDAFENDAVSRAESPAVGKPPGKAAAARIGRPTIMRA